MGTALADTMIGFYVATGGFQLDVKYRGPFRPSHNLSVLFPCLEWLLVFAESPSCLSEITVKTFKG